MRSNTWKGITLLSACLAAAAFGQTYPTEAWPSTSTVQALNGTTDSATGLPYIAVGTNPGSTPPLREQIDRRFYRQNLILAHANQGRVVKVTTTTIGVFPIYFRIQGTNHYYTGTSSQAVSTTDDTYYVYLTSDGSGGGTLNVVSDGTGWPADITTFIPLAEVTVSSSAISTITDVRNRLVYATVTAGAAASTGVDGTFFILDQDNASTGVDADLRFNRGSDGDDAGLRWDAGDELFDFLADVVTPTYATVRALTFTSNATTGTAPFTVASTTKVSNLNADSVDGLGFTAPAEANGLAYSTSTSAVDFTAAPTAADVLYADDDGVPTWGAIGETSGVQGYDADLDALAGVSSTGLLARTDSGTAAARTLTAGNSITVTNGDGVSGNPTISVSGATQYAVQVGDSSGSLDSITVGTDNTVLAGRTGNTPIFRKLVEDDIDSSARIELGKLERGTSAQIIVADSNGIPTWRTPAGGFSIDASGNVVLNGIGFTVTSPDVDVSLEVSNKITVSIEVDNAPMLLDVWLSDVDASVGGVPGLTSTAATSVAISGTYGEIMQTVTSGKFYRMVTDDVGNLVIEVEYTGGAKTWYLTLSLGGFLYQYELEFS